MKAEPIVTVAQELTDRTAQREKLAQFFTDNPMILWSQATLADMCGADRGAVRTRINELKRGGMNLIGHSANYRDMAGVYHRAPKTWQFLPRPVEPLGPDASTPRAEKHPPKQLPLV